DVIFDTVATASVGKLRTILRPGGRVVTAGAVGGGAILGPLGAFLRRALGSKLRGVDARIILASANVEDLSLSAAWLGDGTWRPVVQRAYPLGQTAEACRELEGGRVAGKLVINVD